MNSELMQRMLLRLTELENDMATAVDAHKDIFQNIDPEQTTAAKNLLQYLVLRNNDIRELQDQLHMHGLSSLASSESHIHNQLQSILQRLGKIYNPKNLDACTYEYSRGQITQKSKMLFGEKNDSLTPYVMVTFDSSFAEDYAIIKNLLQNGMNVARINCAHDNEATWSRMIQQIKRASRHTGIPCKIYMDLAGPKIRVRLLNKGSKKGKAKVAEGELVWLSDNADGLDQDTIVISPNEPGIIPHLKKGERVFIDDGIIKGIIEKKEKKRAAMRIVRISSAKRQLKAGKGINFPDSAIDVPSLTEFDKSILPFICEYADLVGYSFVRYPSDLATLQELLQKLSPKPPDIIVKIETPEAVKNLPGLLFQGMKQKVFGAMIARGDLAVEIGFERMGEIQDEILWICEAAHVPVVWATQVLETLNKSGVATRSEITDAAHAALAECVMINKGDYTIQVIETLRDIMHRMGGHHIKKRHIFRPLSIAGEFLQTFKQE